MVWVTACLAAAGSLACRAGEVDQVVTMRAPDGGISPQVVVDDGQAVHLIYFKGKPQGGDILYVRSTDGGQTFSHPIRVNSTVESVLVSESVRSPHLALGKGNRVHVSWQTRTAMTCSRLNDEGTAFEREQMVSRFTSHLDGGGSIAADRAGHVYVVWHANAGGHGEENRRVYVARSRDGGKTFERERSPWWPAARRANGSWSGPRGWGGRRVGK